MAIDTPAVLYRHPWLQTAFVMMSTIAVYHQPCLSENEEDGIPKQPLPTTPPDAIISLLLYVGGAVTEIPVVRNILSANERLAAENRALLEHYHICAVNVMASPGAGKTSLILRTAAALQGKLRVGVVEGDVASRVDADRVAAAGIPVVQINTGGACHLEAPMVGAALEQLPLSALDLLFIENIGNLICPVDFQLGEQARVVVSSIPEGDDKPHKYPGVFVAVDAVVLNKLDLAPYVSFDRAAFRSLLQGLNPVAPLFELSCTTGEGIEPWAAWLVDLVACIRGQG